MLTWKLPSTRRHSMTSLTTAAGFAARGATAKAICGVGGGDGGGGASSPDVLVIWWVTTLNVCPRLTVGGRSTVKSPA